MATIIYPYDPSGVATTNLITDELRSVQPPSDINQASFVIPLKGPFFVESLKVYTGKNKQGTRLIEGKDFFITHEFVAGTNWLGKPLAGGIAFTNALYTGNLYFTYQTLGGDFVVNDVTILESITRKLYADVRFVTWDQLTGVPSAFPPDAHQHVVTDIKTLADVVTALNSIAAALVGSLDDDTIAGGESAALSLIRQHLSAASNAHTPQAVGLGNVSNFATASEEDAVALRNDRFMTPSVTSYLVRRMINSENLTQIRADITTLDQAVKGIKLDIANMNNKIASLDEGLAAVNNSVNLYRQEIQNLGLQVEDAIDQAQLSTTIATQALSQSAATEANIELIAGRVDEVIYTDGVFLPPGTHYINLPAGARMNFKLIGGGGGSGRYFNTSSEQVIYAGGPTSGEDSVLWFLGDRTSAIEPVPLLVAGGGLAGTNAYGNIGRSNSGNGGVCQRFRSENILVSQITNINLTTDLVTGDTSTQGTPGIIGDTSNTAVNVSGVGGWKLDASGDGYHQTYGRGCRGTSRAGMGGSAGKWEVNVKNDTLKTMRFVIQVGKGGVSARTTVNDEVTSIVDKLTTSGVAVLTLIN